MEKCRFYMKNNETYEDCFKIDYEFKGKSALKVLHVDNGVVLPLKKNKGSSHIVSYSGGVTDSKYNFKAGIYRGESWINLSCTSSYVPEEDVAFRNESVVFGGILFNHFGHMITDSMSRFWYFAHNPNLDYKIVFLSAENEEFKYTELLDLMDIAPDKYEIITKPVRFNKIYIPEQALIMGEGYNSCWLDCFDYIREKVKASNKKKVFLSRLHFKKDSVNETYYMEFFKKRGFEAVFPEELSLKEQISVIGGAEEVVAVSGTLVHLCQFCRPNTKLTILSRTSEVIKPLIYSVKARGLDCCFVEGHINFLPTTHAFGGVYLFAPTKYFKKYLQDNEIEFSNEELESGEQIGKLIYEYMKLWTENYSKPANFKKIANTDILDVLEDISDKLFDAPINADDFDVKKKEVLMGTLIEVGNMLENLSNENQRLKNENKMMRSVYDELMQNKIK